MNTEQMLAELAKLDKLAENRNINKTHMYGRFFEKHRDYFLASIAPQAKREPVGYVLETPSMYGARLINGLKHNTPLYAAPQPADRVRELENDAVRELKVKIQELPRYSFLSPKEGGVRRFGDKSGAWIERYEVITILDNLIESIGEIRALIEPKD